MPNTGHYWTSYGRYENDDDDEEHYIILAINTIDLLLRCVIKYKGRKLCSVEEFVHLRMVTVFKKGPIIKKELTVDKH